MISFTHKLEKRTNITIFALEKRTKFINFAKKKHDYMGAIVNSTPRTVTVRLIRARWNRIQHLENAYKMANTIKRGMKQAETAKPMSVKEAMEFIDKL